VGQEADHALVDLHALRRFRAIGRYRALATLRRDGANAVGDDQSQHDLEREQTRFCRALAEQGEIGQLGNCPGLQHFFVADAAEFAGLVMFALGRGADDD